MFWSVDCPWHPVSATTSPQETAVMQMQHRSSRHSFASRRIIAGESACNHRRVGRTGSCLTASLQCEWSARSSGKPCCASDFAAVTKLFSLTTSIATSTSGR